MARLPPGPLRKETLWGIFRNDIRKRGVHVEQSVLIGVAVAVVALGAVAFVVWSRRNASDGSQSRVGQPVNEPRMRRLEEDAAEETDEIVLDDSDSGAASGKAPDASFGRERMVGGLRVATQAFRLDDHDPEQALFAQAVEMLLEGDGAPSGPPLSAPEVNPKVLHRAILTLKNMDKMGETFAKFQAINDPDVSLEHVAQAISRDVVFSTKVLRAANAPYFGYPGQVTSMLQAVVVLGLNNLKTLYFREHFQVLDVRDARSVARQQLWRHVMLTAIASHHAAHAFDDIHPETAFTLGLLHDMGKFILLNMELPERSREKVAQTLHWESRIETGESPALNSVGVERSLLGLDHALLGKFAMETWGLPDLMIEAVQYHHSLDHAAEQLPRETQAYLAALHAGDFMARTFARRKTEGASPPPAGSLEPALRGLTTPDRLRQAILHSNCFPELEKSEVAAGFALA